MGVANTPAKRPRSGSWKIVDTVKTLDMLTAFAKDGGAEGRPFTQAALGFSLMTKEILDNWTVQQAYEHCHGVGKRPPSPADIEQDDLSEIDAVVASYFGAPSLENRKRAAAALAHVFPRIVSSPLAPGNIPQAEVIRRAAVAVEEHLGPDSDLAKRMIDSGLGSLNSDDWFSVWDSLGTGGVNVQNAEMYKFYKFSFDAATYLDDATSILQSMQLGKGRQQPMPNLRMP